MDTRRPSVDSTVRRSPSIWTWSPGTGTRPMRWKTSPPIVSYSSSSSRLSVGVEQLGQLVDGDSSVDPDLVVREPDDHLLFLVVLVLDLADDLLEEVLDRDEAGRPAVLVEDDRDVDLLALEIVEQVVDGHRLGGEDRGPQDGPDVRARGRPTT